MHINADFTHRALVHAARLDWVASPMAGVERRMLDRVGGEVARATSLVRYAPKSAFSAHTHGGGEEFLVVEGVFQDEHGDYPTGTYVRNPPTSSHTPGSKTGCVILVKLHQFDPEDRHAVRVDTSEVAPQPAPDRAGVSIVPLHRDAREEVRLEHWAPNAVIEIEAPGGLEAFVLEGGFQEGDDALARHSWLRLPPGAVLRATSSAAGAVVWIKTGHLADAVA